jgi:hypothetical protein
VRENWETFGAVLGFLLDDTLRGIDMGRVKLTGDAPEVTVATDPRLTKRRVTVTFWVVPK